MIDTHTYDNVTAWLRSCERPLLVTHERPDGDALGALVGLALALQHWGRTPLATLYEPLPDRYALLRDTVPWHNWSTESATLRAECDAVVIVDTCAHGQLRPIADWLPAAPRTLVIDHHPTRDGIATRADDLLIVDATAGAASLLVAEWVATAGVPLTPALATPLFIGLATDTGWFRFSNTDGRLLRMAATLRDADAALDTAYRTLYEQAPPEKLRLIARMLQSLELHAGGRLATLYLRPADFAAAGATPAVTEDLINEATRLAGVECTILFTENPDGAIRVNFRSRQHIDVAELARQFGGGGHARAAGARPNGTWEGVVSDVIAAAHARLAT